MLSPEELEILPLSRRARHEAFCDLADLGRRGTEARTAVCVNRREKLYDARDTKTTYLNRCYAARVAPDANELKRFDAMIEKAADALARANADEVEFHKEAGVARAVIESVEEYVRTAYRNGWSLSSTAAGGENND